MNKHEKQIYREGYIKGKSKAKIIHTTLVQRIRTDNEKEWENKINWFAWAAIISLILFGVTVELFVRNLSNANTLTTELNQTQIVYNLCIEQSNSHPIITQINATVVQGLNGRCCPSEQVVPFSNMQSWYCDMGDVEEIQ